tara:strand:+ start:372 stop:995 length:624 start_codon:yes stop_codon:yes gene_type:complete
MKLSPEGNIFVFPLMILTGLLILFWSMGHVTIYLPSFIGLILLFCLNFFRDPKRLVPKGINQIVSPADGKIIRIDTQDEEFQIVSVFLNVFDVHVNRMPITGTFSDVNYTKGKFLMAFDHNACDENERNIITIETAVGPIILVQIAGLIARRIICYANKGEEMQIGKRLGFMRFGSRIDLILPNKIKLKVKLGQKVMGNTTIIGTFD